ncbi:MAG: EamA family transporter [Bacteroidetes bacterium]|nr:EamA family transporter [Bacteroidota bacterium]
MSRHTKAILALIYICIIWGTTYLSIRIVVKHFPPFLFAAIRQIVSGSIIIIIALAMNRKADLSRKNIIHQAMVGFLLITMGNGFVSWGEKFIPSGVAALICSLMPLNAVLLNVAINKEKVNLSIMSGLVIGFMGIALIFRDNIADLANSAYLWGMIATFFASSCWSLGSVLNKKHASPTNPIFNSGLQLCFGSIGLFVLSSFMDDYTHLDFFQPAVAGNMLYLVIFGSILAYTLYMYALKELPMGISSLYAYVNPLVAVLIGFWILNEQLTWYTAASLAAIATGVYIVNYGYRKQHKQTQAEKAALLTIPEAE